MESEFKGTTPEISERMRKQKTKDTAHEVAVRRQLYASGLRYRVHHPIPGRARRSIDIAFPGRKVAVFIDGCFWHGCARHRNIPATNRDAWNRKIAGNQERDRDSDLHLRSQGWKVFRFWEHDAPEAIAERIMGELRPEDRPAGRIAWGEA